MARDLIVGFRNYLTSVVVVAVSVARTFRVVLGFVFLSFELTALVLIVTWLFAVAANLVRTFLGFVVWLVASQDLSSTYMELPNHSVPAPFQDVTQSFRMCHSPNGPV